MAVVVPTRKRNSRAIGSCRPVESALNFDAKLLRIDQSQASRLVRAVIAGNRRRQPRIQSAHFCYSK